MGAIRVDKMGDFVFSVSFDDSLVEEGCVSITLDSPDLFCSMYMVGFFFGQ